MGAHLPSVRSVAHLLSFIFTHMMENDGLKGRQKLLETD